MSQSGQHDLGGESAGPVDMAERPPRFWEKRMEVMRDNIARRIHPVMRVDEMRRAIEDLPEAQYKLLGPYQRKVLAIRNVLVEKGVLSPDALEKRRTEIGEERRQYFEAQQIETAQHAHDHDHHHELGTDVVDEYEFLSEAMIELLIEQNLLTADDIRRGLERAEMASPYVGARIVAHAWNNESFKKNLLLDGKAALAGIGITALETQIIVHENTERVHNMVVCTLCSCYPRSILGSPPAWYVGKAYRARAVREPRKVLAEFGMFVPDEIEIRVHDSNADMRYLILPKRPRGTDDWNEDDLARLVTRDSLIGVADALDPKALRDKI